MGLLDNFNTLSDSAKQYALNALARFGNGVGDTVQAIPGNAQRLAQGLLNLPHDVSQTFSSQPGGLFSPQLGQQVNQAMSQPQPANPAQWMDKGMALAGMAPVMGLLGHTVYHGSPHKFDKFEFSDRTLGTGDGSQMQGIGGYFGESEKVAKKYAGQNGNLYKADIPDESLGNMFDLDAPIMSQRHLGQSLNAMHTADPSIKELMFDAAKNNKTGQYLFDSILEKNARELLASGMPREQVYDLANKITTKKFSDAGISGIKYLDQVSRQQGSGTSNYVLFDDQLPRILEVNGQPTGLLSYADEAAQKVRQPTQYELAHQVAQKNAVDMLGLPPNNTAMDRARAMGFDTPAYHATGSDFNEFKPSSYRGASFFAGTPQGASHGRSAGIGDMTATMGRENVIPALLKSNQIDGLSFSPKELDVLNKYRGTLTEKQVDEASKELGGAWYKYFDEVDDGKGNFHYVAKSPITYDVAKSSRKNVRGESISDYHDATSERWASDYVNNKGMGGYLQNDEGGLSIAMTKPNEIRSRFAAFDPARAHESDLLAGLAPYIGVGGLLSLGLMSPQDKKTK